MNRRILLPDKLLVVLLLFLAQGCSPSYIKTIPTEFRMSSPVAKKEVAPDSMRITGFVFSKQELAPIEHVIAMEEGSSKGVFTDEHGGFQFTVSGEDKVFQLHFKMIGYSPFTSNKIAFSSGSEVRILLLLGTSYTVCP